MERAGFKVGGGKTQGKYRLDVRNFEEWLGKQILKWGIKENRPEGDISETFPFPIPKGNWKNHLSSRIFKVDELA